MSAPAEDARGGVEVTSLLGPTGEFYRRAVLAAEPTARAMFDESHGKRPFLVTVEDRPITGGCEAHANAWVAAYNVLRLHRPTEGRP